MDRCRYCGDLMPPDAFRPGYCEPCEDEGRVTAPMDPCWFHGEEPVPGACYRVCLECGHAWTRESLIDADAELRGERIDSSRIWSCPLCVHDF